MPILRSNRLLVWGNGLQNFKETFNAMQREFDRFCDGVNESSQDDLGCSPRGITLLHFFNRRGFLAKGYIVIVEWAKHSIEQA